MILEGKVKYIKVVLNLPLKQSFAYKVPAEVSSRVKIGGKVLVPFRRKILSGFVVDQIEREQSRGNLKEIIKVMKDFPPLSNSFIELGKWISDYYYCSLGQALHSIFPIQETFRIQRSKESERKTSAGQKFGKLSSMAGKNNESVFFLKEKGVFLFKTEDNEKRKSLYLPLIKKTLEKKRQVILIVPEIGYLPILEELIHSYYEGEIAILHSRLSSKQRYEEWYKISRGEVWLAIGTRSAVFAPFSRLGLIIVEEEENSAYKQIEVPRYHLRDVAIKRAEIEDFSVVLFTASPSLESWHRAKKGIYKFVEFSRNNGKSRQVRVMDMRKEKDRIFSLTLEEEIQKNLEENNPTLLFFSRRGFANFLLCHECGKVSRCPNCDISLTLHLNGKLTCHYCGYEEKAPRVCSSCRGSYVRGVGLGTEQLEIEVKKKFPQACVRRGDLDVINSSLLYKKLRSDLIEKKIDILVGTQLIIREEILSYISLVGIILADGLLNLPDFRAGEYLFQLLTKTKRLMKPQGRLIIQTYNPTHYTIEALAGKEENFYERESQIRKDLEYPPYLHWIRILLEGRIKTKVEEVAEALREKIEGEGMEFLGPSPCPFAKIKGKYRYHLVLKDKNLSSIRQILEKKLNPLFSGIQGVRGIVDVDPLRTM
jgi:primosomal protein N' (replication factor Y)